MKTYLVHVNIETEYDIDDEVVNKIIANIEELLNSINIKAEVCVPLYEEI